MYRISLDGTPYAAENFGEVTVNLNLVTDKGAYFFRRSLSDDLRFYKAAYNYVSQQIALTQCERITILIEQQCSSGWETILTGYFSRYDCEINLESCYLDASITVTDEYTCLLDNQDTKVNFLDYAVRDDLPYQPIYGLEVAYGGVPPCSGIGAGWGNFHSVTPSGRCLFARYVVRTKCVGGVPQEPAQSVTAWNLLQDDCAIDGTATWWREVLAGELFIDEQTFTCTNLPDPCDPPTCNLLCIDGGVLLTNPITGEYTRYCLCPSYTQLTLPNGRKLTNTIDYMLSEVCPTLTLKSDLLQNNINPVTGQTPNNVQDLYLFQKSDITNPTATGVATDGNISISDLISDLSTMFNAFWYVDNNTNKLVFEHVTGVLSNSVGVDLTTLDAGKWDNGRRLFSYDADQVPKAETFTFATEGREIDFVGLPITYDSGCARGKQQDNRTEFIETELVRIYQNIGEGNEGFMLIAAGSILQDDLYSENGELSQLFVPNAPLAWANLHEDYFKDYRYLLNGTLNGNATVFNSTRPIKVQENIIFPVPCLNDFDPLELVRTSLGDGRVTAAVYNLDSQKIECTLKYEDL